jgi:hypothetical protein
LKAERCFGVGAILIEELFITLLLAVGLRIEEGRMDVEGIGE